MADRALRHGDGSLRDVVELDKDERWQARLAEARARRQIALRGKEKDGDQALRQRAKPWEEEGVAPSEDFAVEPLLSETPGKKDFADRVDAIRESKPAPRKPTGARNTTRSLPDRVRKSSKPAHPVEETEQNEANGPAVEAARSPRKDRFEDILVPSAQRGDAPAAGPSLVSTGAPDVGEIAARYAATLRPEPGLIPEAEPSEPESPAEVLPEEVTPVRVRRRRPRWLGFFLLVLAALPLTSFPPPLDKGPQAYRAPVLALQPALGLPTAMFWRPSETVSGEWRPAGPPQSVPIAALPDFPAEVTPVVAVFPAIPDPGEGYGAIGWAELPSTPRIRLIAMLDIPGGKLGFSPSPGVQATPVPRQRPSRAEPVEKAGLQPADLSEGESAWALRAEDATAAGDTALAAPPASALRVTILVPRSASAELAGDLAGELRRRGHLVSDVRSVDLSISERNLRYFHQSDRAEAARLAREFRAALKDFTWFRPTPEAGTAELWLAGRADFEPMLVQTPSEPADELPTVAEPVPARMVIIRKPGLLERVFSGLRSNDASGDVVVTTLPDVSVVPAGDVPAN